MYQIKPLKIQRRGRPRTFKAESSINILMIPIILILVASCFRGVYLYQHQPLISPLASTPGKNILIDGIENLSPEELGYWESFKVKAHALAKIYNYPAKVLIAQAALESARGRSKFARDRFNFFGMGAFDRNPELAFRYENMEQGILDYLNRMKNEKRYAKAWANRDNPEIMIKEIKAAGYATDPDYVSKVTNMEEWKQ